MNIVMLVKDRLRLTHQAIMSLYQNSALPFTLTIVDDGTDWDNEWGGEVLKWTKEAAMLRNVKSKGITAAVRNLGVFWSQEYFGQDRYGLLYLADNDSYFTPGWDEKLVGAMKMSGMELIGGQNHPYHQPIGAISTPYGEVKEYLALAGTSQLMKWSTWDRFGPLKHGAPGVCQGEDVEFGNKIRAAGGRIGALVPNVVYDCGVTQTGGAMSPGAEVKRRVEGVVYE